MQSRVVASAWPRSRSTGRMHTLRLTQSRSLSFTEAPQYIGLEVQDGWSSDSGSLADLDEVQLEEQVQPTLATGTLSNVPDTVSGYIDADALTSDYHVVSSNALTGAGVGAGTLLLNQAHVFRDFRTGVVDIPMANSGFGIGLVIAYIDGGWQLTASKAGAAVLANGFSSGAGTVTPNTAAPNLITVTVQQ
jgi:hypothetical protein